MWEYPLRETLHGFGVLLLNLRPDGTQFRVIEETKPRQRQCGRPNCSARNKISSVHGVGAYRNIRVAVHDFGEIEGLVCLTFFFIELDHRSTILCLRH